MMVTIQHDTLTIDGAKIYYETAGQGDDVILVHAGFVDSRMWDEQFDFLSKHYRVTRFDLRGYGRSEPLSIPSERRLELSSLMGRLGIQKAALVGCSIGGEAALDYTLEHPEKVSALVLVSTAPGGFEMQGKPPADLLAMFAALEQQDLQTASECQMRLWVDGPFREPEEVDAQVRQKAWEMNQTAVINRTVLFDMQPTPDPLDPPAVQRLREISVPVLIIAGALDHPEVLRAAEYMGRMIPRARVLILSDSAHLPSLEYPEDFNRAAFKFLQMAERA